MPIRCSPLLRHGVAAALGGWLLVMAAAAADQPAGVSAVLQAETFAKIFSFDRKLGEIGSVQVLLPRPEPIGGWGAPFEALHQAFAALGIAARPVAMGELATELGSSTVVYLVPETATEAVLAAITAAGALSISGSPELAEAGKASVSVDTAGGRAEIVIHLARLGMEQHELSAQLMRVARVIREGPTAPPAAPAPPAGQLRPARILHIATPDYPAMARRARVQGDVVLRVRVTETGTVEEVELVRGVTQRVGINEAAIEVARGATFEPARRDGRPVSSWYTLTIPFRL
jgi:TonB family protein